MKPTLSILIVEDDPNPRSLLRSVLQAASYKVLEAATVNAGLSQIDDADIAILDWNMPGEARLFLDQWVENNQGPIAVISNGSAQKVTQFLSIKGAWHVLSRAILVESFMVIVRQYANYLTMQRAVAELRDEVKKFKRLCLAAVLLSAGLSNAPMIAEWLGALL